MAAQNFEDGVLFMADDPLVDSFQGHGRQADAWPVGNASARNKKLS
jgi:hypothetical protein